MTAMRRMKSIDVCSICDELPESELLCLNLLCNQEHNKNHINVSEIIGLMHVHAAAVSRTLKSLEQKGLITRSIDPDNHRNVIVSATDKGLEISKRSHEKLHKYWEKVFTQIPDADVEQLIKSLNLMMDSMESTIKEFKD